MLEDTIIDHEREAYLAAKKNAAMIVPHNWFVLLCATYFGPLPALHAVAYRHSDGAEGILIDSDQFKSGFGQDLSFTIPYELEHEAQELWLTRGKDDVDPYGEDHYEAIRLSLLKAYREGNLDAYIQAKRLQYRTMDAMGIAIAMSELDFYKTEANKLKGIE